MATRNEPAVLTVQGNWEELFGNERSALERILPDYLRPRRWFGGKTKDIRSVTLKHVIPIPSSISTVFYNLVQVGYVDGALDQYAVPLTFASGAHAKNVLDNSPHAVAARLEGGTNGILVDALAEASFGSVLLEAIGNNRTLSTSQGEMRARALGNDAAIRGADADFGPASSRFTNRAERRRTLEKVYHQGYRKIDPVPAARDFVQTETTLRAGPQIRGSHRAASVFPK